VTFTGDATAFVSLNDRAAASMVMTTLNHGGDQYSILPYAQFKAQQRAEEDSQPEALERLALPSSQLSCGLTPMFESANLSFAAVTASKRTPQQVHQKRRLDESPAAPEPLKRQKSVIAGSEGAATASGDGSAADVKVKATSAASPKPFAEPDWE